MQKINPPRRQFLGDAASDRDLVPTVDPEHLKAAWDSEAHTRHPGQPVCFGVRALDALLPEEADVNAVAYRAGMLNKLYYVLSEFSDKIPPDEPISRLGRFKLGEEFDRKVITVMAGIRLEWMQMGFVYSGWPFDMNEFIRQVEQEPA